MIYGDYIYSLLHMVTMNAQNAINGSKHRGKVTLTTINQNAITLKSGNRSSKNNSSIAPTNKNRNNAFSILSFYINKNYPKLVLLIMELICIITWFTEIFLEHSNSLSVFLYLGHQK